MNKEFSDEQYWTEAWIRHLDNYLSAPPRAGYWMNHVFPQSLNTLEIAGGSCRDSHYLASQGVNSTGTDFDQKTIDYLEKKLQNLSFAIQKEDAFAFSFDDKHFDISFSNGFWVLFENNDQIYSLIHEQSRITKKFLVSLVHNVENDRLVNNFKEKAKTDSLYNIRFFHRKELLQIVQDSGLKYNSLTIEKFGGPLDRFLVEKIKGINNPVSSIATRFVPALYKYQPWSVTERIAVIIELE